LGDARGPSLVAETALETFIREAFVPGQMQI
jgi:hypothetical protein